MLTVRQLDRTQLIELKVAYLNDRLGNLSYEDICEADSTVNDSTIFDEFSDTIFSEDDFF
jgi:hypothetical protein